MLYIQLSKHKVMVVERINNKVILRIFSSVSFDEVQRLKPQPAVKPVMKLLTIA